VPEGDLAQRLDAALRSTHHSACDVSDSRVILEIAGPETRAVLAQGVGLDLHPRVFGPGRCAQTVLARVPVILQQIDDGPRYRLFVRASFAPYIGEWLKIAIAGIAPAA
jgi:sarcosine oxidase subunit gamma